MVIYEISLSIFGGFCFGCGLALGYLVGKNSVEKTTNMAIYNMESEIDSGESCETESDSPCDEGTCDSSGCEQRTETTQNKVPDLTKDDSDFSEGDEVNEMFNTLREEYIKTEEEILDEGIKRKIPSVSFLTSGSGGRYATNNDIANYSNSQKSIRSVKRLTKTQENAILDIFREIEGKDLYEATEFAEDRGYTIKVMYMDGVYIPSSYGGGTVIGVTAETGYTSFSESIIVKKVLNVGGEHSPGINHAEENPMSLFI